MLRAIQEQIPIKDFIVWWLWFPAVLLALVFVTGWFFWSVEQIQKSQLERKTFHYWGEYYGITPSKDEFAVGENVTFLSDSVIRQPVDIRWIDAIYCRFHENQDFHYFYTVTDAAHIEPRERVTREWRWKGELPTEPMQCYPRSSITYIDPTHDVKKTQVVDDKSKTFWIR